VGRSHDAEELRSETVIALDIVYALRCKSELVTYIGMLLLVAPVENR